MSVPRIPGMTDEELKIYALREAQLILAAHIERGSRDPEETVTQLMDIIDREDVAAATVRLCLVYGLRPAK
jgi:hypothetical protein